MKRFGFLGLLTLLACQQEIPVVFPGQENLPVMQAELDASDTEHRIFLSVSTPDGLVAPPDGTLVKCYVNDRWVADSAPDGYAVFTENIVQVHRLTADFHPGDRVRFEAVAGAQRAYADVTVPQPASARLDSASVQTHPDLRRRMYGNIWEYEARTYHFRLTLEDIPGARTYYRTLSPVLYQTDNPVPGDGGAYPGDEEVLLAGAQMLQTDDGVYANVSSPIPGDVEAWTDLSLGVANGMLIFDDSLFSDKDYTFLFHPLVLDPFSQGWHVTPRGNVYRLTLVIEAATLSEEAFRYYNAVNAFKSAGPFNEPVPLRSNVTGGRGFVHIMATTRFRIRLPDIHFGIFGQDFTDIYPPDSLE